MNKICHDCDRCQYIGDGDSICDYTLELVQVDWEPTDEFMCCDGKNWVNDKRSAF